VRTTIGSIAAFRAGRPLGNFGMIREQASRPSRTCGEPSIPRPQPLFHFVPSIGESSGVQQDDAFPDGAVIFQTRIQEDPGEKTQGPTCLARLAPTIEVFLQCAKRSSSAR
jgi:hypothetical protein